MKLTLKIFILASTVFFLTSCSLIEIKEQSVQLENVSYISGTIDSNNGTHPIYVVLLKQYETHVEVLNQTLLNDNNGYQFDLFPGRYIIGAYIDENKNGKREHTEKSALYSQDVSLYQIIEVGSGEHSVLKSFSINKVINIRETLESGGQDKTTIHLSKAQSNIGKIVSLDDGIFVKDNSVIGLWYPLTFLDKLGGGLLMLQDYQQDKIPVIFVHGILGNPVEFRDLIQGLDRDKYQPWVLYYPSGIQLDLVSNYLLKSLNQLKEKHEFTDVYLIAHSMGGLMSRSFLMKHQEQDPEFDVSFYMTINSPLYGMTSATSGVEASPIVIASWRDLATGSDYIKKVHKWQVPSNTAYHLVFSYLSGEEGDGVVPLSSQLSLSLQDEATKIYGFQAQHAQILKDDDFIQRVNKILAKHYQER